MDYSVLNFGQLLFLLGNEGFNIRNIEKINKRIVHLKSAYILMKYVFKKVFKQILPIYIYI